MAIMEVTIKNNWTYLSGIHTIPHIIQNSLQYLWVDPDTGSKIFKSLLVPEEMKFPSGVWPRVKKRLIAAHHEFVENDVSEYPTLDNPIPTAIHLRDYQETAKDAYIKAQNEHGIRYRGMLNIATGGGKCITKDSMIFTARGMEYIGDYDHGKPDIFEPCEIQVINEDRIFEKTKRFYNDGKHLTVKITTEHGFVLEGSETQKIKCIAQNGDQDWVALQDITMEHHALIQKAQNCFGKESFTPHYAKFKSEYPQSEFKPEVTEELAQAFGEQDYLQYNLPELLLYFTGMANPSLSDKIYDISIKSKVSDDIIGFRLPCFPKFFRYAKKELVRSYIKGLFHSKLDEQQSVISYYHRGQKRFLQELQIVLLNFGIVSKRNDEAVEITGPALSLFEKIIINGEEIPEMYKKGQNNFIDRLAKLEVNFEGTEIVDFEIPGTHSFFANGFIAHNTVMAAEVISLVNDLTVYFVHTTDLLIQTVRELKKFFGNNMVGTIGGGMDDIYDENGKIRQIIVIMIQSMSANGKDEFKKNPIFLQIMKAAKLLIIDEAHHSAADTWFWVAMICEAPFRLGLSATPWRVDGRDLLLEGATGPVVYEIDAATLIAKGWLSKPKIILYPVLVQMDERFKKEHIEVSPEFYQEFYGEKPLAADMSSDGLVVVQDEGNNWHRRFKVGIIFNHHRNALIVAAAREALSKGQTVLIIVQQKIHGVLLQNFLDMLVSGNDQDHPERPWFINSDTDNDIREMALNRVRQGKLRCLIGTSLYDEGIDLPSINLVIMAAAGKSETKSLQRLGRSLRLGVKCQYLETDKRCNLLSTAEKPVYCIELDYNVEKYDPEIAHNHALNEIHEYLGNIQHFSATHKEVWGKRTVEDANAREILRMYNTCFSDGLLTGATGIPYIDDKATEIKNLYYELQDVLEDNDIGPAANCLKGVPTFVNGSIVNIPLSPDQLAKHKVNTEKAQQLFKLCAEVLGIEKSVSIACEYKQTKKEVTYIDFIDVCDGTLYKHSWQRLETYKEKKHNPEEGDITEFTNFPVVTQTENMYLDYEQMMRTYAQFLVTDKDDDVPAESGGVFDID